MAVKNLFGFCNFFVSPHILQVMRGGRRNEEGRRQEEEGGRGGRRKEEDEGGRRKTYSGCEGTYIP
jgi:hypothetical protein